MADDNWIEWYGGACPVPARTRVDMKFRCGVCLWAEESDDWRWSALGKRSDIVAYRISRPAEPPKPDTSAEENRLWHGYAQAALGALVQRGVRGDTPEKMAEAAGVVADAMLAEARKRGRV